MSELIVSDGDGEEQFIWMQERGDTCGPACVYMIERMKRLACVVGGEQRITFLTSLLPKGYSEGRGTQSYTALKTVLDRIGIGSAVMRVSNMRDFIAGGFFPFIARVGWNNGGGHFVVAVKTARASSLVCLDPWYGLVQAPLAALPAYSVQEDYRRQMSLLNVAGGTLSGHVVFPNRS
ncbi:MAG: cysteine peptidase family C39 domain-containing protein [Hyphomicrobiales bacterium]